MWSYKRRSVVQQPLAFLSCKTLGTPYLDEGRQYHKLRTQSSGPTSQSPDRPCGICGGRSGSGTGFFSKAFRFFLSAAFPPYATFALHFLPTLHD
jgi:hypothetical protein